MRIKTILLGILLLLTLLVALIGTSPQYVTFMLSPPFAGPCDPSTEKIEMNTRLTKGLGVGYTPSDMHCSVFCLQVPEGSELKIGIADLDMQLSLRVTRDLYPYWDPGFSSKQGTTSRITSSSERTTNPVGRYYIHVCPGESFGEFWSDEGRCTPATFTDATLFTLYNEFLP